MGRFFGNKSEEQRARWYPIGGSGFGGYSDLDREGIGRDFEYPQTLDESARMAVIWQCLRIRAGRIASMDIVTPDGDPPRWLLNPDPPPDYPNYNYFRPPQNNTIRDLLHQYSVSMDIAGNAFFGVKRSGGRVANIWCLDPAHVRYDYNDNGDFFITFYGQESEIYMIPNLIFPGYPYGLSPIEYQRVLLATNRGGERQAQTFFQNSSFIPGVITTRGTPRDEQMKQIHASWRSTHGGVNRAHLPAVLGDADWKPLGYSQQDSQFLESRQYNATQIAAIFGVDPSLIGLPSPGGSLQYSTLERREAGQRVELQYVISKIEDALSSLSGTKVKLVAKDWSDEKTKYQVLEIATRANAAAGGKLIHPNQLLDIVDLPHLSDEEIEAYYAGEGNVIEPQLEEQVTAIMEP